MRRCWRTTTPIVQALAGLARCYVGTGNIDQAQKTLEMVPEGKQNDTAVAAARAEIELAAQTKDLGSIADLEAKVAADPKDYQARFDLALAQNAKGDRATPRPTACSKSSSVTASGTMTERASSSYNCSMPGGRRTRQPSTGRRKLSSVLFA